MTPTTVVDIGRDAVEVLLIVSAPMLGAALVTGLIVSIFQAATQVQERWARTLGSATVMLGVAASTGAVSGRTPRHRAKDSAACSTSMPSPSRAMAPWARAQSRKACAAGPYIMSSARLPGWSTSGPTGMPPPDRLAAVPLMNTS